MDVIEEIKSELEKHINPEKAAHYPKFFKTQPGEYGEGDLFLGVTVPNIRKVAKQFKNLDIVHLAKLLQDPYHEVRMLALIIMVNQFTRTKSEEKMTELVELYLDNLEYVNNWDLVDASCPKLLGPYLIDRDTSILYELAKSDNLWKQRIAIMSTFHFIRQMKFEDTLKLAEILLEHPHDLIHKAVGWMLREIGNRDLQTEMSFLDKHYRKMPRTMLRYAIEKFDEELRQEYLKGTR